MYAERSGMAYVVTKVTTMSSRQKVSSKIPRKRWGVVENKKICGGFCEKLGMGLGVGFRYYVNTSVVVCCNNNESQIWRQDTQCQALQRLHMHI